MRQLCLLFFAAAASPPNIRFEEVRLPFVLENSPTPQKHLIETMPGGVAAFDYNGDGRPDLFFTNGAAIPSLEKDSPKYFNRLYRNDGGMKFTDVTAEAGVAGVGYSMGVAAADFDNDGNIDLFVAGVNRNLLYRNLGNGKFADVTAKAGIRSGTWAVAAGWFDYDNDGKLDLWVVHYAKWSPAYDRYCGDADRNLRVYCHPKYFEGLPSTLYRNLGDGKFEDVSERAGIAAQAGRGMSVAFADYDNDGFPDAFVTNDNMPNFLFHNKGNGTFEETALLSGVAMPDSGKAVASMGVDFRDYDNDGLPDLSVTALAGETFPLFRNAGKGAFSDATHTSKIASLSLRLSGWGNGLFDFNNDGWKDLFTANSHVNDRVEAFEAAVYKQPNSIFTNQGKGVFAMSQIGEARAHRGAAFGDFNGDGRIDVAVSSLGEAAELWVNTTPDAGNWIVVRLIGRRSNRDGIGARIHTGSQYNHMITAVGYASSSYTGVHFGLGKDMATDLEVRWPSGVVQRLTGVKANQVVTVQEEAR